MLHVINTSLSGIPAKMVPALSGQGNPYAVDALVLSGHEEASRIARVGAAIACFISGYKTSGRSA